MNKIAFAVPNLGATQLNFFLVMQANKLLGTRTDVDFTILFENVLKPCLPMNFAAMHITEGWGFDGAVVATTLSTAEKLLRFPSVSHRFFYAWDLEYHRPKLKQFRRYQPIYSNRELTLVARSEDHASALQHAWNRPVDIVNESCVVDGFLALAKNPF